MAESVDGQDDARPGLRQQIAWYYTKARRQLPYIGTDSSGAKIPGGPYTILQPIAAILVGGLAWFTRPIWAADMSWVVSLVAVAAVAMSAGYFSGMIDVTEQNPLYAVIGAVRRLSADSAGTLGGVPVRPRAHKPSRKLTITCARQSGPEPSPPNLQPASASPPAEAEPQELTHGPNPGSQTVAVPASAKGPGPGRPPRSNPWVRRASETRTPTRPPGGTPARVFGAEMFDDESEVAGPCDADAARMSGLESLLAASRAETNLQPSGQERWTE